MSIRSDSSDIIFMQTTRGWAVYRRQLQEDYYRYYNKLLDCSSDEIDNIRGITKGIKMALDLADIIKGRG